MILRLLLVLLSLGVVACGSARFPEDVLAARFAEAARDAENPEPSEVVTDLPVLRPRAEGNGEGGAGWVWDDRGRVQVVVWARRPPSVGPNLKLESDLWVTPAPSLGEFCSRLFRAPKKEVRLRLEQLLGLPPGAGEDREFVELWVMPEVLFRPCPDPETDDSLCDLHAPLGEDHRRWFVRQEQVGRAPDGALWTRLGVTYDWGNPYSEKGLPVLVAPAGTSVDVARVVPTQEYCGRR